MKKLTILAMACFLVLGMTSAALANDFGDRFGDGIKRFVTSPAELITGPKDRMEEAEHAWIGLVHGILEAPFHFIHQAGKGLTEALVSPFDVPLNDAQGDNPIARVGESLRSLTDAFITIIKYPIDEAQEAENAALGFSKGLLMMPAHAVGKMGYAMTEMVTSPMQYPTSE